MPPAWAMAHAMLASVTVSMFALTIGTRNAMRRLKRERVSGWLREPIALRRGTSRTSSYDSASGRSGSVTPGTIAAPDRPTTRIPCAMRLIRQPIPLIVAAVLLLAGGCSGGDSDSSSEPVTSSVDYVVAVQELLGPPLLVARRVATHMSRRQSASVEELVQARQAARRELTELRQLRLDDAVLDRQRDDLARAFVPVMARMDDVIADVRSADHEALARSGPDYFDALEDLPSAVSSS